MFHHKIDIGLSAKFLPISEDQKKNGIPISEDQKSKSLFRDTHFKASLRHHPIQGLGDGQRVGNRQPRQPCADAIAAKHCQTASAEGDQTTEAFQTNCQPSLVDVFENAGGCSINGKCLTMVKKLVYDYGKMLVDGI